MLQAVKKGVKNDERAQERPADLHQWVESIVMLGNTVVGFVSNEQLAGFVTHSR
jgi:hypothetical protein